GVSNGIGKKVVPRVLAEPGERSFPVEMLQDCVGHTDEKTRRVCRCQASCPSSSGQRLDAVGGKHVVSSLQQEGGSPLLTGRPASSSPARAAPALAPPASLAAHSPTRTP